MTKQLRIRQVTKQIWILFFIVFLYLVGFGLVIPLIPTWAKELQATEWQVGLLMSAYSFWQFVMSSFWGAWSDRWGRKPILIFCLLAEVLIYAAFSVVTSYVWLLLVRAASGFFGGSLSTATAAISDLSPPEKRSQSMGLIGAGFGLGMIVGPALGGAISWLWGAHYIGWTISGLYLLTAAACWFFLPETLASRRQPLQKYSDASAPLELAPANSKVISEPRFRRIKRFLAKPILGSVYLIGFFQILSMSSFEANLVLWVGKLWGWGLKEVSVGFVSLGLISAATQGFLVRKWLPRYGEKSLLKWGLGAMVLGLLGIPFCSTPETLFLTLLVFIVGYGAVQPSVLGTVSLLADPKEQGAAMGVSQSLSSLARILGPLSAGFVYEWRAEAAFFLASLWAAVGVSIVVAVYAQLPEASKRASASSGSYQ